VGAHIKSTAINPTGLFLVPKLDLSFARALEKSAIPCSEDFELALTPYGIPTMAYKVTVISQ
jgi:hypothetical protein